MSGVYVGGRCLYDRIIFNDYSLINCLNIFLVELYRVFVYYIMNYKNRFTVFIVVFILLYLNVLLVFVLYKQINTFTREVFVFRGSVYKPCLFFSTSSELVY